MPGKRARSECDDIAARSRVKRRARPRRFSSPPREPALPAEGASGRSPPTLPLTRDNLRRLEQSTHTPDPAMGRSPLRASTRSPDKSTSAGTDRLEPKKKLQLYRVYYDVMTPIPAALADHVAEHLRKARDAASPNAAVIARKAPAARSLSEQDGIDTLRTTLLFESAGAGDGGGGGEPFVRVAAKANLSTAFVPPPADPLARFHGFEQPQPDHAIGYITSEVAGPLRLGAPFSEAQENVLNSYALTTELYFPFFTAQWKSPRKSQTHEQAIPQGARDGATIVNYLHRFFATARPGVEPGTVETCHFSATIDLRSIILWAHWRDTDADGNVRYHMEQVEAGLLDKERDNRQIRTLLRNLQDFALSTRLEGIRQAIPSFGEQLARQKDPPALGSASAGDDAPRLMPPPPTPSSSGAEPSKKRPRTDSDGDAVARM